MLLKCCEDSFGNCFGNFFENDFRKLGELFFHFVGGERLGGVRQIFSSTFLYTLFLAPACHERSVHRLEVGVRTARVLTAITRTRHMGITTHESLKVNPTRSYERCKGTVFDP